MKRFALGLSLLLVLSSTARGQAAFEYHLTGRAGDAQVETRPGFVLAGGGADVDAAMRWLIKRAEGGDALVLRASGGDGYHAYLMGLGRLDSVETIVCRRRAASAAPKVLAAVRRADLIFFAGGDQSKYLALWRDSPLEAAIKKRLAAGVPCGGTSAGLAVLGGAIYTGEAGSARSKEALLDPYHRRVTLAKSWLDIPMLAELITDSHFTRRRRLGRLAAFLARLDRGAQRPLIGLGIDEGTALMVDENGWARLAGRGSVRFVSLRPRLCQRGQALVATGSLRRFAAAEDPRIFVPAGCGDKASTSRLTAAEGRLTLTESAFPARKVSWKSGRKSRPGTVRLRAVVEPEARGSWVFYAEGRRIASSADGRARWRGAPAGEHELVAVWSNEVGECAYASLELELD